MEGHADFLAVPHAAIKAQLGLEGIKLDYVKPVARRYNVILNSGTFAGGGSIEYAPTVKVVHLQKALIEALRIDYVHMAQAVKTGPERAQQVRRAQQRLRK